MKFVIFPIENFHILEQLNGLSCTTIHFSLSFVISIQKKNFNKVIKEC